MSKTESHKRAQSKAAGKNGRTEVPLKNNKILDALTNSGCRATEIERGDNTKSLLAAAQRLRAKKCKQKVLQVPNNNMKKAVEAMKRAKVKGTVKNMSSTKRRSV